MSVIENRVKLKKMSILMCLLVRVIENHVKLKQMSILMCLLVSVIENRVKLTDGDIDVYVSESY